jgi:hypothetical protein
LGGLPAVVPVDDPVVPVDAPVVVPDAVEPPVPDAPPVPLCAKASGLAIASAVANPIVAGFMIVIPFLLSTRDQRQRAGRCSWLDANVRMA